MDPSAHAGCTWERAGASGQAGAVAPLHCLTCCAGCRASTRSMSPSTPCPVPQPVVVAALLDAMPCQPRQSWLLQRRGGDSCPSTQRQ